MTSRVSDTDRAAGAGAQQCVGRQQCQGHQRPDTGWPPGVEGTPAGEQRHHEIGKDVVTSAKAFTRPFWTPTSQHRQMCWAEPERMRTMANIARYSLWRCAERKNQTWHKSNWLCTTDSFNRCTLRQCESFHGSWAGVPFCYTRTYIYMHRYCIASLGTTMQPYTCKHSAPATWN